MKSHHVIECLMRVNGKRLLRKLIRLADIPTFAHRLDTVSSKFACRLEFLRHHGKVPPRQEYFLFIGKMYDYVSFFAAGLRVEFKPANGRVVHGETVNAKPFQFVALQQTTLS